MPEILCDYDIQGQFEVLLNLWTSTDWIELWRMLDCQVHSFRSLHLPIDTSDLDLWQLCQNRQFLLVTGNRNADSDDSLEITLRRLNQPHSLPVVTIADAKRIMVDRHYAEHVASQILELIYDLEKLRGTRRLYVP